MLARMANIHIKSGMSKKSPNGESRFDFERHSAVFTDPVLERALASVRNANEYLAGDTTVGDEEIHQIIEILDSEWPYLNVPVRLTGKALYADPLLHKIRPVTLKDKELISKGWTREALTHMKDGSVLRVHELDDDEEESSRQWQIDHLEHRIVFYLENPDGEGAFLADIDDVAFESDQMSFEHISNLLHYHHESDMRSIDALIMARQTPEARIFALQKLGLAIPRADAESFNYAELLAVYLSIRLEADPNLPYACIVDGPVYIDSGQDDATDITSGAVMPMLLQFDHLAPHYSDHATINEYLQVEFDVHGTFEASQGSIPVTFNLGSIIEFQSMRDKFYTKTAPKKHRRYENVEPEV